VTVLHNENFHSLVGKSKAALVEFYAPWCGHCKQLAPKYEQLGNIYSGDSEVLIGKVDATDYGEIADK
jgi:protein disulfide-isomerase A6